MKFKLELFPKGGVKTSSGYTYTKECISYAVERYKKDYISKSKAIGRFNGFSEEISITKDPIFKITDIVNEDGTYYVFISSLKTPRTIEYLDLQLKYLILQKDSEKQPIELFEESFCICWSIWSTSVINYTVGNALIKDLAVLPKHEVL